MSTWSRDLVNYHNDYCHVRYHPTINLSKFGDIWLQLWIVMSNLSLSLVSMLSHAESYGAYFKTTVAAAGASRKIADNIFCVPKGFR